MTLSQSENFPERISSSDWFVNDSLRGKQMGWWLGGAIEKRTEHRERESQYKSMVTNIAYGNLVLYIGKINGNLVTTTKQEKK